MRRRLPAPTWVALAAAVLIPLGAVTAVPVAATAAPSGPAGLPHVAGGYLGGTTRVAAKVKMRASETLPASVDLRADAPPVGDQGQIGACVAWTIAYDIMGYYAKKTAGVGAPYAPLFLYLRNVAPGGAPNAGLYPDAVLANAQAAGVDTQADYWQGTTNWQTPPTAAQIANATNYKVAGWTRLFAGPNQGAPAQTVIQQALAAGSPVALSFPVFNDFMYLHGETVYNTLSGATLGGHMVAAFGYDAQGVWLRNSWGTAWGNRGDVKVSWAFITKVVDSAYTVAGIKTPAAPVSVPPTVAALSVKKAAPGTAVTISGSALAGATSVTFGGQAAAFSAVTANDTTKLVATAPEHAAGIVDVVVTTPAGTSTVGTASKFTFLPPAPAVSGVSPASVSIAGGTALTITGTGLSGVTAVKVGGRSVPVKAGNATSLSVVAPAHAAGEVDVTVTNVSGTSPTGPAARLTYVTPPPPVVTSLSPDGGLTTVATPVVVTGANLADATKVTVNGKAAPFVRLSPTSLRVTLAKHAAGVVAVLVNGPGGVSTAAAFTYTAPPVPVITALSASTGPTNASTALTLTGTGLTGATKVTVGGRTVPFVRVSDTELRLTARPRAAGAAAIVVTTPGGTSAPAAFAYVAPAATVRVTA